ncbi:hypothetical protein DFJ74DRAFT_708904 [Hyaloraphidium curvatum]|nr:hypothetical protein DFJ74DRAFT_708904 [Hyaloraphidium curvatum]
MSQENPGPNSGLDAIVCDETKVTCEQLDIPRLREPCKAFLEDLPTAMVLQVLGDADDFPEIKELVLPLAAKCFQNVLWNQDLSKLSSRLLAELLKRSDLKLASEFQRLFAIVHYIERKSPTIADPFLDEDMLAEWADRRRTETKAEEEREKKRSR